MLWPERDAAQGRALLNTAVHAKRKELGAGVIQSVGDALLLDGSVLDSDVSRLERHASTGRPGATRALAFALARRGEFGQVSALATRRGTSPHDALFARTLVAFGSGDSAGMRATRAALASAPEPVIRDAATAVTTLMRRPSRARPLYELLVAPERARESRWTGHTRLADLAMAEGGGGERRAGRSALLTPSPEDDCSASAPVSRSFHSHR